MINSESAETPPPAPGARHRLVLGRLLATLALLAGPLMLTAPNAHADTGYGYCFQSSCNGKDPVQENCQNNVTTVSSETYTYSNGARYEVDLRYSVDCEANWARVVTSTAQNFCIKNSVGNVDRYRSAPNVASWTNMINGAPNVSDTAHLQLPSPTEWLGQQSLYASDQPASAPKGGEEFSYPC